MIPTGLFSAGELLPVGGWTATDAIESGEERKKDSLAKVQVRTFFLKTPSQPSNAGNALLSLCPLIFLLGQMICDTEMGVIYFIYSIFVQQQSVVRSFYTLSIYVFRKQDISACLVTALQS